MNNCPHFSLSSLPSLPSLPSLLSLLSSERVAVNEDAPGGG